jgi:LPS export ABC transporter protein LptC
MFLGLAFLFWGCPKAEHLSVMDFSGEPDIILSDFIYTSSVLTNKVWEIKCAEAEKYEEQKMFLFKDIELKMFEGNKVQSVLTAKFAVVNYLGRNVTARSNVVLVTSDRSRLYTSSLTWDDARKLLRTDDFVRIVRDNGDVITGYGLEMDQKAQEIVIKHRVKGKFREENEKRPLKRY